MAKVLLGVTGSVAAIKTPELVAALKQSGHDVKLVATRPALYFFDRRIIPCELVTDDDEWPGRDNGRLWQRNEPVLHIELRRWSEVLMIAPLDANSLAKIANGICDNCLTCVWRAWDVKHPVLLAPAMNTLMWEHPHTIRHLHSLADIYGLRVPSSLNADDMVAWINAQQSPSLRIAGPIEKKLACGDIGQGAMIEVASLLKTLEHYLTGK